MLPIKDLNAEDEFIVMVTRAGTIKKTPVKDFSNPLARGIIAMGMNGDGDQLIGAKLSDGKSEVFLATRSGMGIRFPESGVRPMGRSAHGVRGMSLAEGDEIIGLQVASDPKQLVLSVTECGYGKRTALSAYRLQTRGGRGVINLKTTTRTGPVVAVMAISETPEVMVISQQGKIIRVDSATIRQAGRASQGVRIIRMEEGDQVAAASVLPIEEQEAVDPNLPLQ